MLFAWPAKTIDANQVENAKNLACPTQDSQQEQVVGSHGSGLTACPACLGWSSRVGQGMWAWVSGRLMAGGGGGRGGMGSNWCSSPFLPRPRHPMKSPH